MREITEFMIHCSASNWGDMAIVNEWHIARGWITGGYHFYIGNCYPTSESYRLKKPIFSNDGRLETGRDLKTVGAHTRGHNKNSIGICLFGKRSFTEAQFLTLKNLLSSLEKRFPRAGLGMKIMGHYEYYSGKTCPNLDMNHLRKLLNLGD